MIGLIIALIIIGVLLGFVESNYLPMPPWMKIIIRVVCILAVVVYLWLVLPPLLHTTLPRP